MIQRFITDGKLNVGYFLNKKDLGKCEMELFQTSANDLSLAMDGKFRVSPEFVCIKTKRQLPDEDEEKYNNMNIFPNLN